MVMSRATSSSYVYQPLPEGSIRLLKILPHPDENSIIECQLFTCNILKSGRTRPYEALSYVWGSEEKPRSILVDGRSFPVGENLHEALRSLRDPFIERLMWIDAICINQDDNLEKGHQVDSMTRIYARAGSVIVWLGGSTSSSCKALETIHSFAMVERESESARKESLKGPLVAGSDMQAIMELLVRPWFGRIWILQEIAAARHIVVKCGDDEIDGQAFSWGLQHVGKLSRARSHNDARATALESVIQSVTYLMKGSNFRPRLENTSSRYYLKISPLCRLIDVHRRQKSTKRCDKIYALLGMSSDDPGAAGLLPEYGIPWEEVVGRFFRCILGCSRFTVTACEDSDTVVISSRGCVLGQCKRSNYDPLYLAVDWSINAASLGLSNHAIGLSSLPFHVPMSLDGIQEDDVLYLMEGAKIPMIIRMCQDYSAVIRIADSPFREVGQIPADFVWQDDMILVWDWQSEAHDVHPRYLMDRQLPNSRKEVWKRDLKKAVRLLSTLLVIYTLPSRPSSLPLGEVEGYTREMEALEIFDRIPTPSDMDDMRDYDSVVTLFARASSDQLDRWGRLSPLWLAASTGRTRTAKRILSTTKTSGLQELCEAVERDNKELISLLLNAGKVNASKMAETPRLVNALAEKIGKDPWAVSGPIFHRFMEMKPIGEAILHAAVGAIMFPPISLQLVPLLAKKYGISLNTQGAQGRTLLRLAAADRKMELIIYIVESVRGHSEVGGQNKPTLSLPAAQNEHISVPSTSQIVRVGQSQLTVRGVTDATAMFLYHGRHRIVDYLTHLGRGELDARDESGRTLLMHASSHGWKEMVDCLVESGQVSLNARDQRGRTALVHALRGDDKSKISSCLEVAYHLLKNDQVDIEIRDEEGESVLTWLWRMTGNWVPQVPQVPSVPEIDENRHNRSQILDFLSGLLELYSRNFNRSMTFEGRDDDLRNPRDGWVSFR